MCAQEMMHDKSHPLLVKIGEDCVFNTTFNNISSILVNKRKWFQQLIFP